MKPSVLLTGTTLLTVLFLTLHVADDIARGIDTIGLHTLPAMLVLGLWLYGTLVLGGRAWGYLLQLLFSILGLGVVIIHLRGAHMGHIAVSSGGVLFVWVGLTRSRGHHPRGGYDVPYGQDRGAPATAQVHG
jgi:hypothetical protein